MSLPRPSKARCLLARSAAAGIEYDSDVLVARRLAASLEKANAMEHVNVMVDGRTQSSMGCDTSTPVPVVLSRVSSWTTNQPPPEPIIAQQHAHGMPGPACLSFAVRTARSISVSRHRQQDREPAPITERRGAPRECIAHLTIRLLPWSPSTLLLSHCPTICNLRQLYL